MRNWVGIALLLIGSGVVTHQYLLVFVGCLIVLTIGLAWLWVRGRLRSISYERRLMQDHLFPDETTDVILQVTNRSAIPIAWLDVHDDLNENITLLIKQPVVPIQQTTALLWYERIRWRYPFTVRRRGRYRFGQVRLTLGDPFGLFQDEEIRSVHTYLLVYPRLLPLTLPALPARAPLGEARTRRPLVEDPSLITGARPYQPGDPFKRIHWTATARSQQLQSKVYEFNARREAMIMLDTTTFIGVAFDPNLRLLDMLVEIAAASIQQLLEAKYAVGLCANAATYNGSSPISVAPSRAAEQWSMLLETLALLVVIQRASYADLLLTQSAALRWGTLLVLITAFPDAELGGVILALRQRGHQVVIFSVATCVPDWVATLEVEYYTIKEGEQGFVGIPQHGEHPAERRPIAS